LFWTSSENIGRVRASLSLVESFARYDGRRLVVAGTCAEYGAGRYPEDQEALAPWRLYGQCKHALHLILAGYARQVQLSLAWARFFFLYGPHERPERLVPSIVRALLRGQPARCSEGRQSVDFLHVEDASRAVVSLLDSSIEGPVNIASGQEVKVGDVIRLIASKLRGESLVQWGAIPSAPDEPEVLVAEARRLREQVGWRPRFDINDGLDQTIDWWSRELDQRGERPGSDEQRGPRTVKKRDEPT
jgi:nucleoside-diphosphate-sugar epimerase